MSTSRLLQLDDDTLVLVLTHLPQRCRREWIYVALTSRRLRLVAARAHEEALAGMLQHEQLPGVWGNRVRIVGGDSSRPVRIGTSFASVMETPQRFVYAKRTLTCRDARDDPLHTMLNASVPPQLRSMPPLQYDPRNMHATHMAMFVAAHNLTTFGIYVLLRTAPLPMVRGSFFDVLGGVRGCAFNPTLRHHRALVMFACLFGRVDVLDYLVHADPNRAKAYDFASGLLSMLDEQTMRTMATDGRAQVAMNAPGWNYTNWQILVVRPAYMSNSVPTLEWIQDTVRAMATRRFGGFSGAVGAALGVPQQQPVLPWGFFLGVTLNHTRTSNINAALWKSLNNALTEAASVGATEVLGRVLHHALGHSNYGAKTVTRRDAEFANLLTFTVFLAVLKGERNGASHGWLVEACRQYATHLTYLARLGLENPATGPTDPVHAFNNDSCGVFDLEDLMFVYDHRESFYVSSDAMELMEVNDSYGLRERILRPGDVEYNRWLLRIFAYPMREGHHECWPWPWIARSVPELHASSVALVRMRMCPSRWDTKDALCRHLLRAATRQLSVICNRASQSEEQPEAHVYWNRLARTRAWVPHLGLSGPSRLADGMARVLHEWLLHVILHRPTEGDDGRNAAAEAMHDWWHIVTSVPVPCVAVLQKVCARTLVEGKPHEPVARRFLGQLLLDAAVTMLHLPMVRRHVQHADGRTEWIDERVTFASNTTNNPYQKYKLRTTPNDVWLHRIDWTCAVALVRLLQKHELLTQETTDLLRGTTAQQHTVLGESIAEALAAH